MAFQYFDEDQSSNASCALNNISTFTLDLLITSPKKYRWEILISIGTVNIELYLYTRSLLKRFLKWKLGNLFKTLQSFMLKFSVTYLQIREIRSDKFKNHETVPNERLHPDIDDKERIFLILLLSYTRMLNLHLERNMPKSKSWHESLAILALYKVTSLG